jgi:hypothetical protein
MRRMTAIAALGVLPCIAAAPAFAQSDPELKARAARFAQVHALMAGPGPEDRIDARELQAFLAREIVRRTLLSPAVVTREWVNEQVVNLMNQADTNRDGGIDERELADLEAAKIRLLPNLRTATATERESAPTVDFKTLLPKAAPPAPQGEHIADRLAKWLQIRQSFLDEKLVEKPATVSFSTFGRSDETVEAGARRNQWSLAAAVIVRPTAWVATTTRWEVYPVLAYEAALSSGLKKDVDSITHRVGAAGSWLNGTATVAHAFSATFDYNTDHEYASTVLGGTAQYTPGVPAIGVGRFTDLAPNISFTWRPYLGLTFGDVRSTGERTDLKDKVNFTDLYGTIGSKLVFSTHAAVITEVSVSRQLREAEETHGLLESSFNLYITPENSKTPVSLQLSGALGRKSPAFKKQQVAKVALAFKF